MSAFNLKFSLIFVFVLVLQSCSNNEKSKVFQSMDGVADDKIGVLLGSTQEHFIAQHYPDAVLKQFTNGADMCQALRMGECDLCLFSDKEGKSYVEKFSELGVLTDSLCSGDFAMGFRKEDATTLTAQFNKMLDSLKANGTLKDILERWTKVPGEGEMPDIQLPKSGEPLKVGTTGLSIPNSFIKDGQNVGVDMELVRRFAAYLGRPLEVSVMNFPSLIPSLKSGKLDMIANSIMVTDERKKQIDFSNGYMQYIVMVLALKNRLADSLVSADDNEQHTHTILDSFKESFHSNLIQEKRYLLILDGLKTTFIISLFAAILGTLIGGLICYLRMSGKRVLRVCGSVYVDLMRGTPVLVILMIMFYVVLARTGLSATNVAIVTFAMNFAAYVSEMFRSSIEGVDRGQTEAGIAMGFTRVQTFVHIVMPQAVRNVLPIYKGELISLIKMTSIVGYVAVEDLTKASDIIRSRTFDAFFPLIVVAILYFILSWLFAMGLDILSTRILTKKQQR